MTGSRSVSRGVVATVLAAFSAVLLSATMIVATPGTAQAAKPTPWATFYAHEIATSTREEKYRANLQAALEAGDVARTATTARVFYDYAKREATWLTTHPPQPCYKAWWGYVRNYWTQTREGAADILKVVQRSDTTFVDSALAHLEKAQAYKTAMATHLPTC